MSAGQTIIRRLITPNDQLLRSVFSVPKAYFIDIYQREYRWSEFNVRTLLTDIESQFSLTQRIKTDRSEIQTHVLEEFEPYFLNTYLTHTTPSNICIVDGQQRLTTFLLIFIKLNKMLKLIEADSSYPVRPFASQTIEKLIFETNDFGEAQRFKIYNKNREAAFRSLVDGTAVKIIDETSDRIRRNYSAISNYYNSFFALPENDGRFDVQKITYYITYLLDRISVVEIKIEKQKNVATIFEVVNDRGEGLQPYEILKGKLIGNLPADLKEKANSVWTELQDQYFNAVLRNSTDSRLDLDMFFRTYFRAKFADSETDYEKFEGKYHYQVYRDPKLREYFKDFNDPNLLFQRVTQDIKYFAEKYLWLRTNYENEFLLYNKLLDQDQQYLLILSALKVNDPEESTKISAIARKFDQMHAIIRLLDAYESRSFQSIIYPLVRDIRNGILANQESEFDEALIESLEEGEVVPKGQIKSISDIFSYERFSNVSNKWTNFTKYVLMRIDRYLSILLDKPSYASAGLSELEERFNKRTTKKHAMHLEHVYAFNEPNKAQFTGVSGFFNETAFRTERDQLGMLLLLTDKDNLSSGNAVYRDKIDTYKKSDLIWNDLFVGNLSADNVRVLPDDLHFNVVAPTGNGSFPRDMVESRQKLVFNAIKKIWG